MEPSNQKSQMDQEYGLLPADARQQKGNTCKPQRVEQFSLFINDEHLLGCHVRINNPTLSLGTKNPILLPAKHLFVDLLVQIKNVHERVKQGSQQHTHHHTREILDFARKTDRQTCAKI